MDIFKLLSRSTNLSKRSRTLTHHQPIPSDGQTTNPQLFRHDDVAKEEIGGPDVVAVLGKRKRKESQAVRAGLEVLPPELDFFAEKNAGERSRNGKRVVVEKTSAENGAVDLGRNGVDGDGLGKEEMGEEECRAILRAHKIKVTMLSESVSPDESTRTQKRRGGLKEMGKGGIAVATKARTQIYPRPLTSFAQLRTRYGISKRLAENIAYQGYKLPTEVQLAALPLLMDDVPHPSGSPKDRGNESSMQAAVNLLTVAPTGSGKTLAFLIPALHALFKDKKIDQESEAQAIIVAPTRELANQIVNEGRKLVKNTGIRISLVRKGMRVGNVKDDAHSTSNDQAEDSDGTEHGNEDDQQIEDLDNTVKSHVLVSTPLALVHAIQSNGGQITPLPSVRYLVLDEADVLLDPLFREQTLSIWSACTNPDLRVSLWSATMGSSIETVALENISQPRAGTAHSSAIVRLVVGLKDTALPNINHTLTYAATETGKLMALRQLLHPTTPDTDSLGRKALRPPFLIFTQTIERAKALHAELRYDIPPEAGGSARIAALHSDMSETARGRVMTAFRRGEIWVIITTDLLARGIDFRGLNGVVNYDVPASAAAYVHRVGRTGRAGREGGLAVTLYTKDDIAHIKPIANVIAASEKMGDRLKTGEEKAGSTVQQWLLDALPTPSKRDKQILKKRGVESRRAGTKTARISTKSKLTRPMGIKNGARGKHVEKKRSVGEVRADEFEGFSD